MLRITHKKTFSHHPAKQEGLSGAHHGSSLQYSIGVSQGSTQDSRIALGTCQACRTQQMSQMRTNLLLNKWPGTSHLMSIVCKPTTCCRHYARIHQSYILQHPVEQPSYVTGCRLGFCAQSGSTNPSPKVQRPGLGFRSKHIFPGVNCTDAGLKETTGISQTC